MVTAEFVLIFEALVFVIQFVIDAYIVMSYEHRNVHFSVHRILILSKIQYK